MSKSKTPKQSSRKGPSAVDHNSPLEKALNLMRRGWSQTAAAEAEGVDVKRLRRHRLQNTASKRQGNRWVIFDQRATKFRIVSRGEVTYPTLPHDAGSEVSAYWHAVNRFLNTNDPSQLALHVGEGVRDVNGRFHEYETRPNTLRKLDAIGELSFLDIYADTAPDGQ
jgi:hypothetical protein